MYNFCKNAKKNPNHKTTSSHSKNKSNTGVRHEDNKFGAKPGGIGGNAIYFKWLTVVSLVRGISGNIGRVKRKGNEAPSTSEGNI